MMEIIQKLQYYLEFPFVRYALIVGVLIALCSSLIGTTLVLKRYSFIGDGLSHVAFGAMAVASVLNIANKTFLVMPVTILVAILLLKKGQNTKSNGDSMLAMISVGTLAMGYLILNMFSKSSNLSADVCSTLFGSTSILTLSFSNVVICSVFSVLVILLFILFYNRIFAVTFDEDFVKATGGKAERYNLLIAVIISMIIVLGINLVGSLLISALIIFPSLSSMRVINQFKGVVILSAIISVLCAIIGIIFSILLSTPVGSTIVLMNIIVYIICSILNSLKKGI